MTDQKKKRGRPKGTGINDMPLLQAIADLIVDSPSLGVATALKKVRRKPTHAEIRRIQIKWKTNRERLLAEAAAPPKPAARIRTSPEGFAAFSAVDKYARIEKQMKEALGIGGTFQRAVQNLADSPVIRAQRELERTVRSLTFSLETPTDRLMREVRNSPFERMMREMCGIGSLGRRY